MFLLDMATPIILPIIAAIPILAVAILVTLIILIFKILK